MTKKNHLLEKQILANIDLIINLIIKIARGKPENHHKYLAEIQALIQMTSPLLLELLEGKQEYLAPTYQQLINQKLPISELSTNFAAVKKALAVVYPLLDHPAPFPAPESAQDAFQEPSTEKTMEIPSEAVSKAFQELSEEPSWDDSPELTPEPALEGAPASSPEPAPEPESSTEANAAGYEETGPVFPQAELAAQRQENIPFPTECIQINIKENVHAKRINSTHETNQEDSTEKLLEKLIALIYPQEEIIKNYELRSITFDYYLPKQKIAIYLSSLPHRVPTRVKLISQHEGIRLIEIYPEDFQNSLLLSGKLSSSFHKLFLIKSIPNEKKQS
ncbi:MAG TPA: hypothetical protein PLJ33_00665 [Peptococcaceae bacterium]|jgi:hypothetical protein|nr:hypothetical protein [Peptococcaceae bacterium]HPZ71930.1 hypothetical protein [Peptococcaceae bacterium]HQD53357.1 hypothetical protein [Peptococcaceae bacterium]